MNEPTHVSTFAGIDGIGLGLQRAGFTTVASVEIDKFCNRVRAKRCPDVPQFGDIRQFGRSSFAGEVDILSGGFPCQDLSIAGKRAGIAGARSGLFYEFVRVARELRPTWLLVENVPGLLSSNDARDFAVVLDELGNAGYFVEGRVLDSQWFGVAQRRRRVFLVGHLGGPPARPVLFEPKGRSRHPAPRQQAGEDLAGTLGGGAPDARGWRGDLDSSGAYIPEIGRALTKTMHKKHDPDTDTFVAHTLTSGAHGRAGRRQEDETNIVPTLLTMREGKDGGGKGPLVSEDQSLTLATGNGQTLFQPTLSVRIGHQNANETGVRSEQIGALGSSGAGFGVMPTTSVRRLTPTECERLQGFPDGWTCLCDADPCVCPDGPRYAALGNAVTVNVAEWIGRRIVSA